MKKTPTNSRLYSVEANEKLSSKILMEKMGLSPSEFKNIINTYGVGATKLLEIMQLSKYQFVFPEKLPGECAPCATQLFKGNYSQRYL